MGYDYFVLISVVDIPESLKQLKKENEEKFQQKFQDEILLEFKQAYDKILSIREEKELWWFPEFGKIEHSGGYECTYEFKSYIGLFTSQFPEFTFGIYLSYDDLSTLDYWTIKNTSIISEHRNVYNFDNDPIEHPNINVTLYVKLTPSVLRPKNCITYDLNPEFDYPYENEYEFP